jgi:hypothetical protein
MGYGIPGASAYHIGYDIFSGSIQFAFGCRQVLIGLFELGFDLIGVHAQRF